MDTHPQAQTSRSRGTRHFEYIDALRGTAFLGVLTFHIFQRSGEDLPGRLGYLAVQGGRGVQLFFVISALTLIFSCRSRFAKERRPLQNFFIRRFMRIAPLFWFGIVFYTYLKGFEPRHAAPDGIGWREILATVTFMHGWDPNSINSVVPGGWSIAVEMTFYLLVPFLVARVTTMKRALSVTVVGLAVSMTLCGLMSRWIGPTYSEDRVYLFEHFLFYWFPYQLPVFLLGFVLYQLIRGGGWWQTGGDTTGEAQETVKWTDVRCWGLLGLSVIIMVVYAFKNDFVLPGHFMYGIAFVLLAWSLSMRPVRVLVNRPICYIGKLSFSCYICHFAVMDWVVRYLMWRVWKLPYELPPGVGFVIFFILALGITVGVSFVTYHLIEVPGIALGKVLIEKNEARSRN